MKLAIPIIRALACSAMVFPAIAFGQGDAIELKVDSTVRQIRVEVYEPDWDKWIPVGTGLHDGASSGWLKVALSGQTAGRQLRVMTSAQPSVFADKIVSAIAPASVDSGSQGGYFFTSMTPDGRLDTESPTPEADIELPDIWAWQGETLYFFNQYRGLQVIDMADLDSPRLIAQYRFPAQGEDLYALPDGRIILIGSGLSWTAQSTTLQILRHQGDSITLENQIELGSGDYLDSRRYGDFLYVLTRDWIAEEGTWRQFPLVNLYTVDLAAPAGTEPDAPLSFTSNGYYDAVLDAQPGAILIALSGRNRAVSPAWHSNVHVLEPGEDGKPRLVGIAETAGVIRDKFKMRYRNGVLTTISQQVDFSNFAFSRLTRLENFQLVPDGFARIGQVDLAPGESVFGTRFHEDTVFIVTFLMVDPLFAIDNRDPRRPRVVSELKIPGWSNYLEVVDGWLFAIGPEDGRLAVSQFDFSDLENLQMVSRVYLSESAGSSSEAEFNEQAIAFYPGPGLMLLPFSSWDWQTGTRQQALQLVNWNAGGLTLRGSIAHADQARRGSLHNDAIISISGKELRTTDIRDPDQPLERSQLTLAWDSRFLFKHDDFLLHLDPGEGDAYGYRWSLFEDGTDTQPAAIEPVVHLSHIDEPNLSQRALPLPSGRLLGATLHGNRLWTLQEAPPIAPEDSTWQLPEQQELVVRAWDIGSLEDLRLIGESSFRTERYLAAQFDAKILYDGSVLWLSSRGGGVGLWRGGWDIGIPGYGWWYPQQRAFVIASLDAGSEAVRIEHVESVSYKGDYADLSDWHWIPPLLLASSSEYHSGRDESGRFHYRSTNRLHAWDLSNANLPVKLPLANLPGPLQGALSVDAEHALLFFEPVPQTLSVWGWDRVNAFELLTQALSPSATDTSTYSWAQFWMPPFHGRHRYDYSPDETAQNALDVWWYDFGANRFSRNSSNPIDTWIQKSTVREPDVLISTVTALHSFKGNRITGEWQRTDSHRLAPMLSWQADLDRAVLSPEYIWLPMGLYGVESIKRAPVILPAAELIARTSGTWIPQSNATWREVPTSDWHLSQSDESGQAGKLTDARWLFRPEGWVEFDSTAEDLGDGWRQSHWFGQYKALSESTQAIAHSEHGRISFLHHGDLNQEGMIIIDPVLAFLWTSPSAYPWMYRFQTQSWIYYAEGSAQSGQRWFYSPSAGWLYSH